MSKTRLPTAAVDVFTLAKKRLTTYAPLGTAKLYDISGAATGS
jgi:hypothetical protein